MQKEKKIKLKIIIVIIIAVLIIAVAIGVFVKLKYEQSSMTPVDTGEIVTDIFAVRNTFTNFFLVKSGDEYIAIDAGSSKSITEKELQTLSISADDVTAVFLTHSHNDHVGALKLFGNAKIYKAGEMTDGEIINMADLSVKCIDTPGHMKNSVSYLIDEKFLFVGDNLSLKDDKIGLFNSFFNTDDEIQRESIKKLSKIWETEGVEYIITAHYGFTAHAMFP